MAPRIHRISVDSENSKLPILGISGSLRGASSNTAALEAVRVLAPARAEVTIFRGLGDLPHFNPDLDHHLVPAAVQELRAAVGRAAAILISSPEYAHGVAGAMKNLLDWLVSSLEFPGKPVGLINTAPRAFHADAALKETLTTMSAKLVPGACIAVPIAGRLTDPKEIAADPQIGGRLMEAVEELARAATSC
jgi:NAD(P)H-dependent FMN reductase